MNKKIGLLILLFNLAFFVVNVTADDLIVSGPLSGSYISNGNIYSQGTCTVEPGFSATLEARFKIKLYPGFSAKAGCSFTANAGDGPDSDSDGMPDWWENQYGLDPQENDSDEDPDDDGLSNINEYWNDANPNNSDTDEDVMPDGWEVASGLNPIQDDSMDDLDEDGCSNYAEYVCGTDPGNPAQTPVPGEYNRYDILGRLIRSFYLSGSQIEYDIEYEYDSIGNRTFKEVR